MHVSTLWRKVWDQLIATHAAETTGIHGFKVAKKTADETVNDSAVLQDDDELKIAMGANECWVFLMWMWFNSGAVPDIKYTFTLPANATMLWDMGSAGKPANAAGDTDDEGGTGANILLVIWGGVLVGDTAGDLQFQWAQKLADASDTKVLKGSAIVAWRIV